MSHVEPVARSKALTVDWPELAAVGKHGETPESKREFESKPNATMESSILAPQTIIRPSVYRKILRQLERAGTLASPGRACCVVKPDTVELFTNVGFHICQYRNQKVHDARRDLGLNSSLSPFSAEGRRWHPALWDIDPSPQAGVEVYLLILQHARHAFRLPLSRL